MPDILRVKRRAAGGAAGPPASLGNAEIAYNEQDNTLYYGVGGTPAAAASILAIAGPGAFVAKAGDTMSGSLTVTSAVRSAGTTALSLGTTNSGEVLRLNDLAGARTSRVEMSFTPGTNTWNIGAGGTAANLALNAIAGGGVYLNAGLAGNTQFQTGAVGGTVNWLQASGSTGTAGPVLAATGSATNLDIVLTPKGTGLVRATTPTAGTNDTSLATTAFVATAISGSVSGVSSFNTRTGAVVLSNADVTTVLPASSTAPTMDSVAAVGTGTTWARSDHVHPSDTTRQTAAQVVSAIAAGNPGAFSTLSASSNATIAGNTYFATGTASNFQNFGTASLLYNQYETNYYWQWNRSNGNLVWVANAGNSMAILGADRSFWVYASAWKPGGGVWSDSSDLRLKRNIEPYLGGLAEVCALRPVTYEFNGTGETADDGKRYHGLIAQEVQPVMPEMVSTRAVQLNKADADETDILTVDATPMLYALVNAVQELAARVAALEARA